MILFGVITDAPETLLEARQKYITSVWMFLCINSIKY